MKITFIETTDQAHLIPHPLPSKNYIPEWYKNIKNDFKKNPIFNDETQFLENTNLKMCMPFLDSFTSGYIQETWCDIYIENNKKNKEIKIYNSRDPKIIGYRDKKHLPTHVDEFYPFEFYWINQWAPKTPQNYSLIISHPFNRLDLPFYTLSGIIDSDKYFHAPKGNFPFYIKNNFEGLIPAGTPMFQIIPFKRDNFQTNIEKYSLAIDKRFWEQRKVFWSFYKKNFWVKKIFN